MTFGQKARMRRPVRLPTVKGLAPQQQIHRFGQPLLHHAARHLVCIGKKPPAILKPVAVRFLVLYDTIDRHEFCCNYLSQYFVSYMTANHIVQPNGFVKCVKEGGLSRMNFVATLAEVSGEPMSNEEINVETQKLAPL